MIPELSLIMYPDHDILRYPSCTECLTSTYHDNLSYGQSCIDYSTMNSQYSFNLTDYLWRKYYAQLASEFSKTIQTNSFPYRSAQDFECNSSFQPKLLSTTEQQSSPVCIESRMGKTESNSQIWRPFSPPPSTQQSICLQEMSNETVCVTDNKLATTMPSIVPSRVKIEPSLSSVFTPVKKKSHKCSYCSSVFPSNVQLNNHVKKHTGYKAYTCDYPNCAKSFTRNEELTRHRRIHSGYKPHLCTVCGKSFGRKDHLSKHLKTHLQVSEKKVYVCEVSGCGHRYTRSDALTRHKSTAHDIRKIKSH